MHYTYKTQGTCSTQIDFEYNDGIVTDIKFKGGCNGNLRAISKILDGWKGEDIVSKLKGNTCGFRKTSCADQLTKAIEKAAAEA